MRPLFCKQPSRGETNAWISDGYKGDRGLQKRRGARWVWSVLPPSQPSEDTTAFLQGRAQRRGGGPRVGGLPPGVGAQGTRRRIYWEFKSWIV